MADRTRLSAWICLVFLALSRPASTQPSADEAAIYAYTDDLGRLVHVQRLQDVPLNLRSSARRVDLPDASQPAASAAHADKWFDGLNWLSGPGPDPDRSEPVMYRYRGAQGRPVYTNLAASVPLAQRASARIDLRHVSLNSELGTELNGQLQRRFEALQSSKACTRLRAEAHLAWWQRALRDQRPLVVCAAVLLVLLLCTPWMLKRGFGAAWARVLWTAAPLLGFVGLSAYLLTQAQSASSLLAPRAKRCEVGAFQSESDLPRRFALVSALQAEQQALASIAREAE